MALRRSPRLRASGSSGSAPGSASAPPSSSRGSPREFLEDSDSGSDFEPSLRPRSKRGPPRGARGSLAPKRSRLSSRDGKDPEQNSLFEAVFSGKVAMEPLVDEWLERYRRDQEGAFVELLNFTVRSCGCPGVVTLQMFRELQNSEIIRRLMETFQEGSLEYPLSSRSPPWRRFRSGFSELLAALVRRAQHRELRDGFLLDSWLAFLTGLADSQLRPLRHTGTLAALKLMSALVEVALGVGRQRELCQRQLRAEEAKEPARRGSERLEALRGRRTELQEQQEELELLMNGIFKGVFVHRYRDVVPEIRGICMEELGLWVRRFPASFLTDGHLKYLGWTLHDKHGEVRLRCVRALRGIYGIPEVAPHLELFTERFKPRLVAMAQDKEPEVALETLRLLTELDRSMAEALSPEDCQSVFPLVFVSSRALASAAGSFLFQRLLDPGRFGDGAGDNRSFLRRLAGFFLQSRLHEHAAYLVDSLWDCAGSRLRDWEAAAALLLQTGTTLPFEEEQALVQILSSSALRLCQGQPPVGRGPAPKVSARERREQREERARLSRSLIPLLPQLLEKFSAEPEAVAALLELLQHLELGMFRTERLEKCLEQVLGQIQEIFGKHSRPFPALSAASRALRALSDPGLALPGPAGLARSRLGDSLGARCHLQVTELLQAVSLDEEDVYGLVATLTRLSVLFSDHDLTPWGLFGPLAQLLQRGLDGSGGVPAQVMIPAISCLFFHVFWELSRVPDSGASPAELRDLRSRAVLLLSLCQSCLSEPEPELREKALRALLELLLLLGPALPEARLRLRPDAALEAQLALALLDLVFLPAEEPRGHAAPEAQLVLALLDLVFLPPEEPRGHASRQRRLQSVQRRRSLLAAFCRLLLQGALRLRAAADLFKQYGKFSGDFGDILRETLRGTRERDGAEWGRTLLLSLQQLFTELLLQEGPRLRRLRRFRELRQLGRRLALLCGRGQRRPLLRLHSEGLEFALQPPPDPPVAGIPERLPLHLPFLELLSEFSAPLPRPDRARLLALLERRCRERGLAADFGANLGDFGAPLLCYRRSLSAARAPRSRGGSPDPRPRAASSSSPWPPSPALTSTALRGGPPSSKSRKSWGSRLSLMEEEEEEEEGEETPETPRTPLEPPRDLFGSSSLEFQTF